MAKASAAIFILTQNTDVRRVHLKNCLYFLFKNFNEQFRYPVMLFHEGDYDYAAQREILLGVRSSCRSLVSFVELDAGDFKVPDHIDKERLARCIECKATPYMRNVGYRNMCRWWLLNCWKYATGFEYIMRLDDDSIIEDRIPKDLFEWMKSKELIYSSNMMHADCGICTYGMKDFFDAAFPERRQFIQTLFTKGEVPMQSVLFQGFRRLLSINAAASGTTVPEIPEKMDLWMPLIMYNNYFISRTDFWVRPDVLATLKKIDETGNIYYWRWGDAPIQTLVLALHARPDQFSRSIFKYSKRMQREAFIGDNGEAHSYMPDDYTKSSCITEGR